MAKTKHEFIYNNRCSLDVVNFDKVVNKAKNACKSSGISVFEHFLDARKTIPILKGAEKIISDYKLSRYACYLIAKNGDSKKEKHRFKPKYVIYILCFL